MTFFDYMLRANLCLVALFGLYWLLFRRHTFFTLNRVYLSLSVLASALLPLVQLPAPAVTTMALPVVTLGAATVSVAQATGPSAEIILGWVYMLGVALGIGRLLWGLGQLARLIWSGERLALPDFTLVLVDDERIAPFSFFRLLVMNRADFAQHPDPVLRHEQVHIRQGHSLDVLLAEVVKISCWFNPVAWLLQQALQQTHEFLADQLATDADNRADYARFLVGYALGTSPDALTNSFLKPSQLRLRLTMLLRTPTAQKLRRRYWLALPALGLLVLLVAARRPAEQLLTDSQTASDSLFTVTGQVTDDAGHLLSGAIIVIKNGTSGTTTDAKGQFLLDKVPANATLVASFVGYKSAQAAVNGNSQIVFTLKRNSEPLGEVVITDNPSDTAKSNKAVRPITPQGLPTPNGEVFTVVEQQPQFPGGMNALLAYVRQNTQYPAEARRGNMSGKVFVEFVVDETGQIRQPRVLKGIGFGCDEEAVRVVSQMPRWEPGRQNGQPVAVQYNLPIMFALAGPGNPPAPVSPAPQPMPASRPVPVVDPLEYSPPSTPSGPIPATPRPALAPNPTPIGRPIPMSRPAPAARPTPATAPLSPDSVPPAGPAPKLTPKPQDHVLYLLDGVEVDQKTANTLDNIKSVQILKGESAKPYGAKGADRVIIITTKQAGKP